jgi:hypothetical protein
MNATNLKQMSIGHLLWTYSNVLVELQHRGIVRSANNPVGDYAEYLVVSALGLQRAPKSTKGYDAVDGSGHKYEIKGRRPTSSNKSRMLSAIRNCEAAHFDYLAGVLFTEDFGFEKACLVPFSMVVAEAKYRSHVNAHILELRDSLWSRQGVVDISDRIRRVISSDAAVKPC